MKLMRPHGTPPASKRSGRGRRTPGLLLSVTWLAAGLRAGPSPVSIQPPGSLVAAVEQILADTGTPGTGLALVRRDGVEWTVGLGLANVETGRPVTSRTLFESGAISGILLALSALKLEEAGRLSLQRSVHSLAPELAVENRWEDTHPLKLSHLLEHTGGLDDLHVHDLVHGELESASLQPVPDLLRGRSCRWPPGKYFSYSRAGVAMAAFIVARASGKSFESYVRDEWLPELAMHSTTYSPARMLASGYRQGRVTPRSEPGPGATGRLSASPSDTANLLLLLLNRGKFGPTELLSASSLQRMETPSTSLAAASGIRTGYGLCLETTIEQGFLVRGLSGQSPGFRSRLEYLPQTGKGFVVLINSESSRALDDLTGLLRDHLLQGLPRPAPPPSRIPAWRVSGLAGYYRPISPRQEIHRFLDNIFGMIRLDPQGNQLGVAGAGSADVLIPVTDRRFRGPDDPIPSVAFLRDEGRTVLQGTGRVLAGSYRAVPFWRVWLERLAVASSVLLIAAGLLSSLYWIPLWLLRRLGDPDWIELGLFPALSGLAAAALILTVLGAMQDPVPRLGLFGFWSGAVFALSWLFPLFSLLGAVRSIRRLFRLPRRLIRCGLGLACSLAGLGVSLYLWSYGILGIRTWSY